MYTFVEIKGWKYIHQSLYSDYLGAVYLCMIFFIEIFFIFPTFAICLSNYIIRKKKNPEFFKQVNLLQSPILSYKTLVAKLILKHNLGIFSIPLSGKFESTSPVHFHSLSCSSSCWNTFLNPYLGFLISNLFGFPFPAFALSFFFGSPQTTSQENLLPTIEQGLEHNPLFLLISVQMSE